MGRTTHASSNCLGRNRTGPPALTDEVFVASLLRFGILSHCFIWSFLASPHCFTSRFVFCFASVLRCFGYLFPCDPLGASLLVASFAGSGSFCASFLPLL